MTASVQERFNPRVAEYILGKGSTSSYGGLLGIEVTDLEPGRAVCSLPIRPELLSGIGLVHGGAISSLIDHTLSLTVYPLVEPGKWVATLEFKVNYLAAAKEGTLIATGEIVSLRRTTAVVRVDVRNGDEVIAAAQGTLYVRDPK